MPSLQHTLQCLYIQAFIEQLDSSRTVLEALLALNQKLYDEGLGEALTVDRLELSIDQIAHKLTMPRSI